MIFKIKLISQEGSFHNKLFFYNSGPTLYQFQWFSFVKAYKIRQLGKEVGMTYYSHEEIVIATRPDGKTGRIAFKLQDS